MDKMCQVNAHSLFKGKIPHSYPWAPGAVLGQPCFLLHDAASHSGSHIDLGLRWTMCRLARRLRCDLAWKGNILLWERELRNVRTTGGQGAKRMSWGTEVAMRIRGAQVTRKQNQWVHRRHGTVRPDTAGGSTAYSHQQWYKDLRVFTGLEVLQFMQDHRWAPVCIQNSLIYSWISIRL